MAETPKTAMLHRNAVAPQDRTNSPQRAALLLKGEALKEKKNQTFVFYSSENRYISSKSSICACIRRFDESGLGVVFSIKTASEVVELFWGEI